MNNSDRAGGYTSRINRITGHMKEKGIKAVILSPSMNMLYTTGFDTFPGERLLVSIIDEKGEVIFVAPKMYEQEVTEKGVFDKIITWDDSQDPKDIMYCLCRDMGYKDSIIAVEDTMWFNAFEKISSTFSGSSFIKASDVIGELRKCKGADEAEKMREASRLAEEALQLVIPAVRAGMKELEVKEILESEMKKQGLSGPSFDTIIGSGPNSALPHYTAGERILQTGDGVVIDFGGMYQGYCSDMTRTIMLGKASEEYRKVYEAVKGGQQKAIDAVRPGMKACEIDAAARDYIAEKGYGEYFIHRTGHGIGMEVHEEPYISNVSETVLQPGMVFSIEPGVYLPGKFGVRIEDLVMVTETGAEVLNKFTKELIEL